MLFNRGKFEFLNFAKSARTFYYEAPQQKEIKTKVGVRDLGIIFEPNEKFNKHITSVLAKGNCMVGWILWTFKRNHALIIKNSCRIWMYHLDGNFLQLSTRIY